MSTAQRTRFPLFVALLAAPLPILAQAVNTASVHPTAPPVAVAARCSSAVTIDGRIDDPAWQAAVPLTGFRQTQPTEGQDDRTIGR